MSDSMVDGQHSWYVVRTKPRQEFRALEQLQNQRFHCFLPTIKVEKICRGKLTTCIEPLFTRYLFIQLDTVTRSWSPIRSTRGVSELVVFGGRFSIVPDVCVEALRSAPQVTMRRDPYEPGERVAITSGPFVGLEGVYQLTDGEARALVLIELLSQPQRLKFSIEMLRKVA